MPSSFATRIVEYVVIGILVYPTPFVKQKNAAPAPSYLGRHEEYPTFGSELKGFRSSDIVRSILKSQAVQTRRNAILRAARPKLTLCRIAIRL